MKLKIMTPDNKEKGTLELPKQFSEPVRPDLIKRAVLSLQSRSRQAYGAMPRAGSGHVTQLSFRRRNYKGVYGHGISRVPRKILARRGAHMTWVGAFAPMTLGGRRAHPPRAERNWEERINTKENRKAIRSALNATTDKTLVAGRGHKIPATYPFIISQDFEKIAKSKDAMKALTTLGLGDEMKRCSQTKQRAGVGKLRGRRIVKKKGPLLVVGEKCALSKAAKNLPGVEICTAKQLNAELLAPGATPGRLTIFTETAIKTMEGLFQ